RFGRDGRRRQHRPGGEAGHHRRDRETRSRGRLDVLCRIQLSRGAEPARARLNPGGLLTMWVPLYTTTPDAVKSQLATFFDVFPGGFVLGNTRNGNGYDVVLIGQRDPAPISLAAMDSRLRQASYAPVAASLNEVGIRSAADLFESYAGRASDLKPWLAGAAINSDRNLRLQYLAGLGINTNTPEAIYRQILEYRGARDVLFTAGD